MAVVDAAELPGTLRTHVLHLLVSTGAPSLTRLLLPCSGRGVYTHMGARSKATACLCALAPFSHPMSRSFAPTQAYAAPDMPNEYVGGPGLAAAAGGGTCFYGASALAYERLLRAYNYSLVALDGAGVNSFFVHNDELGMPLDPAVHSVAHLTPGQREAGVHSLWAPINADCTPALWVHIGDSPGLADVHFARHMRPELLKHTPDGRGGRSFEVIKTPGVLTMHMRRHPKHDTP